MPDKEKVIKGLKLLYDRLLDAAKLDDMAMLDASMVANAITLLKEQEAKQGNWERQYSRPGVYANLFWWCSACKKPTRYNDAGIFYEYCPHCGAKLEPGLET